MMESSSSSPTSNGAPTSATSAGAEEEAETSSSSLSRTLLSVTSVADDPVTAAEEEDVEDDDDVNGWDDDHDEDDLLLAIDEEGEEDEEVAEETRGRDAAAGDGADVTPTRTENDDVHRPRGPSIEGAPSSDPKSDAGPLESRGSASGAPADAAAADATSGGGEDASELGHHPSSSLSTIDDSPAGRAAATTSASAPGAASTVTVTLPLSTSTPPPPPPPPVALRLLASSSILERRVSVTSSRKHALLVEAREDRARWIRAVPLPHRPAGRWATLGSDEEEEADDEHWLRHSELARMHAVQSLPSSLGLLSHLYRHDNALPTPGGPGRLGSPIRERIRAALDSAKGSSSASEGGSEALFSGDAEEIWGRGSGGNKEQGGPDGDDDDQHRAYLLAYRDVVRILQDPSCAVLVQGMRNFCKKLGALAAAATAASAPPPSDPKDVATKIRSYLSGILPSLASNPAWSGSSSSTLRTAPDAESHRRRAMEAFLYGQCSPQLDVMLWNDDAKRRDEDWTARMGDLQFVTPRHLEIACLCRNGQDDNDRDVDELLKDSVHVLASVDAYYSPYDKLQRILALYRSVNAALTRALNSDPAASSSDAARNKKLPSADDVLPTIILVVLRAQPRRLLHNLRFVEACAAPEALRGEAGYAYTNLYGAVQFLTDLDLDGGDGTASPGNLSIGADEFRRGLLKCREKARERLNKPARATQVPSFQDRDMDEEELLVGISPLDVRAARRQGVSLDVEWALQRLRQHPPDPNFPVTPFPQPGLPLSASVSDELLVGAAAAEDALLPVGFARSYSFLTARPDDVRVSDLPSLLDEYRRLVHTTESLLSERSSRLRAERKARRRAAELELRQRVSAVDPSLLGAPTHASSSAKSSSSKAMNGGT